MQTLRDFSAMEIRNFALMKEGCEGVRKLSPDSLKIHWRGNDN
jgi:hypothetical protein